MAGLPVITSGGTLTAENGYEIPNPAVTPMDVGFTGLWLPEPVGENREVADGFVAMPSVLKQQSVDIPLLVVGEVDSDGDAQTPGLAGLWVNVSELQDVWLAPSLIGDGMQTVTFVPFPGGPTLGGAAKCVGITLAEPSPNAWRVALHLVLPDGPLVEAGS